MSTRHLPVLLPEVLSYLRPTDGVVALDLTLGGGGYSEALLASGASVIGLDRDPAAVEAARQRFRSYGDRFTARPVAFSQMGTILDELNTAQVNAICMDLGLSSDQLDDSTRGFAFRLDGPLDLRFDRDEARPASELLVEASPVDIERWLRDWGELRGARRLAKRMSERARAGELQTTAQLRDLVLASLPRSVKPEPQLARVFQALRILVNQEMAELEAALEQVPQRLRPGGRLVAVSYHSLEDRRVKTMLVHESRGVPGSRHTPALPTQLRMRVLTRKPVRPTPDEIAINPRARSARLRAGERIG